MAKHNHTCKVCGKGYNACDTCLNERNYAPWRAIACVQGHFQAYMTLWEYGNGALKKADAREMLSKVDIEGWENYPEHNRIVIAEIFKEDEVSIQEEEKPIEVVLMPVEVAEPELRETPLQTVQAPPQGYRQPQKGFQDKHSKFKK